MTQRGRIFYSNNFKQCEIFTPRYNVSRKQIDFKSDSAYYNAYGTENKFKLIFTHSSGMIINFSCSQGIYFYYADSKLETNIFIRTKGLKRLNKMVYFSYNHKDAELSTAKTVFLCFRSLFCNSFILP